MSQRTSLLDPTSLVEDDDREFDMHDLLFWSVDELAAAEQHQKEILEEFVKVRSNVKSLDEWMYLNIPLGSVPGAPSRCAYFVGMLAFKAYVEQQELPPPVEELLSLANSPEGREAVWRALVLEKSLDDSIGMNNDGALTMTTLLTLSLAFLIYIYH